MRFTLLLLFATTAHGACNTVEFSPPFMLPAQWEENGVTVSAGPGWWVVEDATPGMDGEIANAPSLPYALYHTPCPFPNPCGIYDFAIWFDPPVRQISFRYTGRFFWEYYQTEPQPAWIVNQGSLPFSVNMFADEYTSSWFANVSSSVEHATDTGVPYTSYHNGWHEGEGVTCSGGTFCNWPEFSYTSATPIAWIYLYVDGKPPYYGGTWNNAYEEGGLNGFWLDNLRVCTEAPGCPHPPCEIEARASGPRGEGVTDARRSSWGRVKSVYR